MSKFQIVLLAFFGVFILLGVGVFSFYKGSTGTQATVTIWGSFTVSDFNLFLNQSVLAQDNKLVINYIEKPADTIEAEFTEALARGTGPDLIIISENQLWQVKSKLMTIPFESISQRDFENAFVEGGEIFLGQEGVYALPLIIDPLVLYYNRDHLSAGGFARPLAYWDELYAATTKLAKRDKAGNITQSAIALGETRNIPHAKDILSLLLLQAGTSITTLLGDDLTSSLTDDYDLPIMPGDAALEFYTQFSNPSKPYFSWNRTQPLAQTHFTSGDSAYYLGFASELTTLKRKSPTLNIGVALVPQSRVGGKTITTGRIYGTALSRAAKNPAAALKAALAIGSKEHAATLSEILRLPPARRDLLLVKPTDASGPVFYDAALQTRSWLDPNPVATDEIWREMVEAVTSGRARTFEALNDANKKLDALTND